MAMSQLYLDCSGELSACQRESPVLLVKTGVSEDAEGLIPAVCFCSSHVLLLFPSAKEAPGEGCQLPAQVVPNSSTHKLLLHLN